LGCFETGEALFRGFRQKRPDVLLVDAVDGEPVDLNWLVLLNQSLPMPRLSVAVLAETIDGPAVLTALMEGARGYLVKPIARCQIEEALRELVHGQPVLTADALLKLVQGLNRASEGLSEWATFSPREKQVLAHLALGSWSKEVASELGISEGAVHKYLHNVFRKLGVHCKHDAISRLMGLLSPWLNPAKNQTEEARSDFPKSLSELRDRFVSEEACRQYLFELRWPEGFCCPDCQGDRAWRIKRGLWLCGSCHRQISVTAGTLLQGTRLPLRAWLRAAWEVAGAQEAVSVSSVRRVLGVGSYKTAWNCVQMLKRALCELVAAGRESQACRERGRLFQNLLQKAMQPASGSVAKAGKSRRLAVEPRG
jgi:DNA-binding NarL/FixJ family response regulator